MRFVDRYQAIAFDMHGTFMFGHDRLDDAQDFMATYVRLGGSALSRAQVTDSVMRVCAQLRRIYDDPAYFDAFPTLAQAVADHGGLQRRDEARIAAVIATHEAGSVPDWAADTLRTLAQTHRLALVSNLWGPPEVWLPILERSGIADVFACRVFSSSIGAIKPSPRPFLIALDAIGMPASSVLFVGDSAERDIVPARRLGMACVQVCDDDGCADADRTVRSIVELLDLDA